MQLELELLTIYNFIFDVWHCKLPLFVQKTKLMKPLEQAKWCGSLGMDQDAFKVKYMSDYTGNLIADYTGNLIAVAWG